VLVDLLVDEVLDRRSVALVAPPDEAIAAALDARLTERKSRVTPNVVGPVEGPTEPQLITVEPGRPGKRASDQG
jgi:hypothetical protein